MMLKTQIKAINAKAELSERFSDDTGSVIEEMGWKGLMIAAALAAGATVAITVGLWASDIQTP